MDELITWVAIIGIAFMLISVSHNTKITKVYIPQSDIPKLVNAIANTTSGVIASNYLNPGPKIITLKLCNTEPDEIGECDTGAISNENTVWIYWEVLRGKGCCATFDCNYEAFMDACWRNENKLYSISFDGIGDPQDLSDYTYNCEKRVPYNWWRFDSVSTGTHTITVAQYDCGKQIVDEKNLTFDIEMVDGKWMITRV